MKKIAYIKNVLFQMTLVASIMLMVSCENNQRPDDTKEVAEDRNDERFDDSKQEKDAQFLVNASEMNLKEIQLGKLAQQKGKSADVKDLGRMMEESHTKSQRELTALAKSKNIAIPTSSTDNAQDSYKELNEKTGDDFDKAYANMMVRGHNDAISTFEKASEDSNDEDIKRWAKASLPELRTHHNHSIDCQKQFAHMYIEEKN